jgi:hypothetical protein
MGIEINMVPTCLALDRPEVDLDEKRYPRKAVTALLRSGETDVARFW